VKEDLAHLLGFSDHRHDAHRRAAGTVEQGIGLVVPLQHIVGRQLIDQLALEEEVQHAGAEVPGRDYLDIASMVIHQLVLSNAERLQTNDEAIPAGAQAG
jgi:hypothetical protein